LDITTVPGLTVSEQVTVIDFGIGTVTFLSSAIAVDVNRITAHAAVKVL
jgi:tRNA A-37 threonylcarbamoyl transferase component Bud32